MPHPSAALSGDDAPDRDAAQHAVRPRPLPLFLDLLRSETAASPERMARALAGLRRYQTAPRAPSPPPQPIVARAGRGVLRDYGGTGPPVLFVPSLINPPLVLDIAEDRSLLRWLAGQGLRPLLLDWGTPDRADAALDLAGHVETILLRLIAALGEPPIVVGYCLGGTLALAAASRTPLRGVVTIAAPWRFDGYPPEARRAMAALWDGVGGAAEQLGAFPMELLQACFWRLDPARTVGKFEQLADLADDDPRLAEFVRLEDWANDGPPLTPAAARALALELYRDNQSGLRSWLVGGEAVRLDTIDIPALTVVSRTDRIVPAATAPDLGKRLELDLGHVGMIVGGRAREALWEPLAAWLAAH